MTSDPAPSWMSGAPGPFVTIRAGGPLEGVVTLTAIDGGHGRTLVGATWMQDGELRSESLEAATYAMARAISQDG